jgi:hypothetical protein
MTLDVANPDTRDLCSRARVWLDGEEVTDRCFYASEEAGRVSLYRLNDAGVKYQDPDDTNQAATEQREGHVTIVITGYPGSHP